MGDVILEEVVDCLVSLDFESAHSLIEDKCDNINMESDEYQRLNFIRGIIHYAQDYYSANKENVSSKDLKNYIDKVTNDKVNETLEKHGYNVLKDSNNGSV
tara:strand:+ start:1660 stop:1962 length:303 start_codon:yes stop_codon:yes gene_type:complete